MSILDAEEETHPSWGLVSFSRVSGSTRLFGSDLEHHEFVRLTVKRARRKRDLGRDWLFGSRGDLIEVWLSPNQFSSLLTTMNVGEGVPGTLKWVDGERIEPEEQQEVRAKLAEGELHKSAREVARLMDEIEVKVKGAGLSGKKAGEILEAVRMAKQQVASNLPFVVTSFQETMEKVVVDAKSAVEAFVVGVVQRTGLKALAERAPRLIEGRVVEGEADGE